MLAVNGHTVAKPGMERMWTLVNTRRTLELEIVLEIAKADGRRRTLSVGVMTIVK